MPQTKRRQNRGLRKICACPRRTWAKCEHSWHFNFKLKGGKSHRFSVDSEAGKHIDAKTIAEGLADSWRTAIRAGTFRRHTEAQPVVQLPGTITLSALGKTYFERRGKAASAGEQSYL